MRFWSREVAGWLLVGLGILVFYQCFALLHRMPPAFLETGPLTVIGIFLFRGGIHLLKVAVAARVCLQTQEGMERDRPAAAAVTGRRPGKPLPASRG